MELKEIRQTVEFEVSPQELYEALLDAQTHSTFTGAEAEIDPVVGGRYTAYDGYISGQILELVPGEKIVQTWKPEEEEWPSDHFSTVAFHFKPTETGAILEFIHRDVPAHTVDRFTIAWTEFYWEPLKQYFGLELDKEDFIY